MKYKMITCVIVISGLISNACPAKLIYRKFHVRDKNGHVIEHDSNQLWLVIGEKNQFAFTNTNKQTDTVVNRYTKAVYKGSNGEDSVIEGFDTVVLKIKEPRQFFKLKKKGDEIYISGRDVITRRDTIVLQYRIADPAKTSSINIFGEGLSSFLVESEYRGDSSIFINGEKVACYVFAEKTKNYELHKDNAIRFIYLDKKRLLPVKLHTEGSDYYQQLEEY